MKTLEQIQEENRKAIILANNPEAKDYEEALEMDQKDLRKTLLANLITAYWCGRVWEAWQVGTMTEDDFSEIEEGDDGFEELVTDLHKPLTLDRVLIALEPYPNNWGIVAGHIAKINRKACSYDFKCKWDLTKLTLEEQTEETQKAVAKLLGFGEGEND
jgi:hypothetical protein